MPTSATVRQLALLFVISCAATAVGCASISSKGRVLRVEYASAADSQGEIESGVIFWRRATIRREEIPADLLEKLGENFPMVLQIEGKLANTCYVTNSSFGLALLKRSKSSLSGPLWFTVDAGWTVEFSLLSDGAVRGTTGYYFANSKPADASALKGSYRAMADFTECYERVRAAISAPAT